MRKIAAIITMLLTMAGIGFVGSQPVGAAAYNACPTGWWVHDYAGSGTVMQCVADGNHIVIRQWIGGVDNGVVFNAYLPGWIEWFLNAATGSSTSELKFCLDGYANNMVESGPIAAGWEKSFDTTASGLGPEGVYNHFDGWAGVQPYGIDDISVGQVCPDGGASLILRAG